MMDKERDKKGSVFECEIGGKKIIYHLCDSGLPGDTKKGMTYLGRGKVFYRDGEKKISLCDMDFYQRPNENKKNHKLK
jgi:hypothetical protein